MTAWLLSLVLAAAPTGGAFLTSGSAPDPVVERTVEGTQGTTRVTVFDNGIAVVSRRFDDRHVLRRRLLEPDELRGWTETVTTAAEEIGERDVVPPRPESPDHGVLRLYADPAHPRSVVYAPRALQGLALDRVLRSLDALEATVLETSPAQVELARWQPTIGDRVELVSGRRATVIQIEAEGVVVVEHDGTHIREVIPRDARETVILALLDPGSVR